jgi:uncharacterized protein YyaL (SSP411 family)
MSAANRLGQELSPYLLQHARNPVDWWPWCDEAFEEARRRDVPVLVSIGYSACHWCHVMERESFEDAETAAAMNDRLVCIKVDREERPDVDALHMEFVHRAGGRRGWPLNVFVTPGRIPFHGGTYFPPRRHGPMPAWLDVVDGVARAYAENKERIEASGADIAGALRERHEEAADSLPGAADLRRGVGKQILSLDPAWGGFPGAPKFPPHGFLRTALAQPNLEAREEAMLRTSLDRIARGGIRDHVAGGFARYSTDEHWVVPHFEKMLYDNAQFLWNYAEAHARWKHPSHARTVRETAAWMVRELGTPEGAFRSALDADSEGEEGLFWTWDWEELGRVLGDDREAFTEAWNCSRPGNFEGRNIPWRAEAEPAEPDPREEEWLRKLREVRERRVGPALDDKVLASWNGLALAGLARAAYRLDDGDLLESARKLAGFCLEWLLHPEGLHAVWKEGRTRHPGTLEDWAFLGEGFLELWMVDGDGRWIEAAIRCADGILERFVEEGSDALRFSESSRSDLLADVSPLNDGPSPSGNGSAARLLAALHHLTGNVRYREVAEGIVRAAGAAVPRFPRSYSSLADAARILSTEVVLVHLAGTQDDPGLEALARALRESPVLPDLRVPPVPLHPSLRGGFAGEHPASGPARAWICRGTECLEPVFDSDTLGRILAD